MLASVGPSWALSSQSYLHVTRITSEHAQFESEGESGLINCGSVWLGLIRPNPHVGASRHSLSDPI